jgi:cellulose synthase/poly-beta-1,6-N-acetylglucosamine synthase-like glycosyltransferase
MLLTLICFLFLYAGLIFFYYYHWLKLEEYASPAVQSQLFLSVVIAARNEESTLPRLINDLERQSYPAHLFEVIIVNDFSTDKTGEALSQISSPHFRMIVPDADPKSSSKKTALTTGIQEAKGELIVITDADCSVSPAWLSTIASFYKEKNAAFIAAPVQFEHNNSLLQIFQSLDFLTLQGITAAGVSGGFHSMCNGANLAYTKEAFLAVDGFKGIDKVATGDDMLLMHKIKQAKSKQVFYLKSKEAIVRTAPMFTWRDLLMQRRRWASKTLVYDDFRITAVLFFVYLFNCFFILLIVLSFFAKDYWWYAAGYLFLKTLIEVPFVYSVARFFNQQKLLRSFFFLQPLHIFYTVVAGTLSQFGKYEWKGRRTK